MSIRKLKKKLKRCNDALHIKRGLYSIKLINQWAKINNKYSKQNIAILLKNL